MSSDRGESPREETRSHGQIPDQEHTGTWLFRAEEDSTGEHYLGEMSQQERWAHDREAANRRAEAEARARVPAAPSQPVTWGPPPTNPPPTGRGRSAVIGALAGLLVLGVAIGALNLAGRPGSVAPAPVQVQTTASSPSSSSPAATESAASPSVSEASPSPATLNNAANALGWEYLIDGLGPVRIGMRAAEALPLGVVQATTGPCGYEPTDLLGATKVHVAGGVVNAIDIQEPSFPSKRGVRVGTSVAQLIEIYGDTLKTVPMVIGGETSDHYALVGKRGYIAYLTTNDLVSRIVVGAKAKDGSIVLPPPTCG